MDIICCIEFYICGIQLIRLSQNIATSYIKIIMITTAAYTFYKIKTAGMRALK